MEKEANVVKMESIAYNVLKELLRYIHTDKVESLQEMATDLLVAADKYEIWMLKDLCASKLCTSISKNNAVDLLIVAHLHQVNSLKTRAMRFVAKHVKDIAYASTFKKFESLQSHILVELFRELVLTMKAYEDL